MVYSPDNRSCLGELDKDTLDVFFVKNYFKELGYDKQDEDTLDVFFIEKLPLVIQIRLEKIRKELKNRVPIWTGDEDYEKFEVHGHPTNMAYYVFMSVLLLHGPIYVRKISYNQPQVPNIKQKPEKLTIKRRKDADEGTNGNKKAKQTVTLKRQLKPFT
ncbi:hypothetical protein Ahy_A08g040129 [Arachis hypogaea]|uniref:PB1-like domain-containing protein n=1 Tax=Arachis hypogaea TaxID=3818 RepID=A0A445BY90_ARAHY|nr:hypothetical protein Ahy_A08g040129 [Arachis hypogaea]